MHRRAGIRAIRYWIPDNLSDALKISGMTQLKIINPILKQDSLILESLVIYSPTGIIEAYEILYWTGSFNYNNSRQYNFAPPKKIP
jgi:hypothetical protein